MSVVNHIAFNHLTHLLEISPKDLIQNLYVSQSLVSRWKNGTRKIKSDSPVYEQVVCYFIEVNRKNRFQRLEQYFQEIYPSCHIQKEEDLRYYLDAFLLNYKYNPILDEETGQNQAPRFRVFKGREGRVKAFEILLKTMRKLEKPGVFYYFDAENYRWASGLSDWPLNAEVSEEFLKKGGKIYIISDFANITPEYFYETFQMSNRDNVVAAYSEDNSSGSLFYSHYVLEDHMSVIGYSLSDDPQDCYTALYTDPLTCKAHLHYVKEKYRNASPQHIITASSDRSYLISTMELYRDSAGPIYVTGSIPSICFEEKQSLMEILEKNMLSLERRKRCIRYYEYLRKMIFSKEENILKGLYYIEDFEQASRQRTVLDKELSVIAGTAVHLTPGQFRCRCQNTLKIVKCSQNVQLHFISKKFLPIYSLLGENLTSCSQKNRWYFAAFQNTPEKARLILDSRACTLRARMFEDFFKELEKEPEAKRELAAILQELICVKEHTV